MSSTLWPLHAFDPHAEFTIVERKLPHWQQAGAVCFLTFRTFDSLPQSVLRQWHAERDDWLERHGIGPNQRDWREQLERLPRPVRGEFTRIFSERWHRHLDDGHGACMLRQPPLAKIVANSLLHFDDDRYLLTDFVVMPNHAHILAAFIDEDGMLDQCESWKHYTAGEINRQLGTSGRFWQQDGFDHLVRSEEHFGKFRRYIADNPKKAGLKAGEFVHYSRAL
jgi:putative transposase